MMCVTRIKDCMHGFVFLFGPEFAPRVAADVVLVNRHNERVARVHRIHPERRSSTPVIPK
jgi:hypothetical protein